MIGLSSDYTELVKEYIPEGQKIGLWEQFLTGTSQQYQNLTQQAQDVYAYDISQAYANYKQQQLQLQMNQQLGEGFKQQVGSQLQSQYGSAFSDIKTQEATALSKISEQYTADILEGQKQFTQLGEQARTFDKLISEYATSINKTLPKNAYKTTRNEQTGVITKELTDYGRLWYSEILDDSRFQDWILSEEAASDLDLEDRETFYEAYRQNPELYRNIVAGLTSEFDYEETKTRLEEDERQTALEKAKPVFDKKGDEFVSIYKDYSDLSTNEITKLSENLQRNNEYITTIKVSNTHGFSGKTVKDSFGNSWTTESVNYSYTSGSGSAAHDKKARVVGEKLGVVNSKGHVKQNKKYKAGDVVYVNNKYYLITEHDSNTIAIREVSPGMSTKDLLKQGVE